ncbi:MAG: hypothetical protein ABIC95_02600 [archaeon]
MKKRGIFFTADAFLAIGIITLGLLLILSLRIDEKSPEQTTIFSQDLIDLTSSTELYLINNRYLFDLRDDGNISNIRYTLLEQAGEFYFLNQSSTARELILNVTDKAIGGQYDFSVIIDGVNLYNTSDSQSESVILVSTKKIIFGIHNDSEYWGPFRAEVRVWRY